MQATPTTRPFAMRSVSRVVIVIALGLIGSLTVGALTLVVTDRLSIFSQTLPAAITAPPITSDALFALEADQAIIQADARHAAIPQITSDALYTLEAELAATQLATRTAPLQLTSDEAWALEASIMTAAAAHQHEQLQLTPDKAWTIEQAQLLASPMQQQARR